MQFLHIWRHLYAYFMHIIKFFAPCHYYYTFITTIHSSLIKFLSYFCWNSVKSPINMHFLRILRHLYVYFMHMVKFFDPCNYYYNWISTILSSLLSILCWNSVNILLNSIKYAIFVYFMVFICIFYAHN